MSYEYRSGLGYAAAYQVSGKPFASGSIDASGGPTRIQFPQVTRWVAILNHDPTDLVCAFSQNGLPSAGGTNYFIIQGGLRGFPSERYEFKVSEMWFETSANFDIIAGLTSVTTESIPGNQNWSGSIGVG